MQAGFLLEGKMWEIENADPSLISFETEDELLPAMEWNASLNPADEDGMEIWDLSLSWNSKSRREEIEMSAILLGSND